MKLRFGSQPANRWGGQNESVVFLSRIRRVVRRGRIRFNAGFQRVQRHLLPAQDSHFVEFFSAGFRGAFRVYRAGLRAEEPVGALFYFDGDYGLDRFSLLFRRRGLLMSQLAETASRFNLLFIAVRSPDQAPRTLTTTWWVRPHANGVWFRGLFKYLEQRFGIDRNRVWFAGYSGGAEFITAELLVHGVQPVRGATMVGGGGVEGLHGGQVALPPTALFWHVGEWDDGVVGLGWSARRAAEAGAAFYSGLGSQTELQLLPKIGHTGYRINELVAADLAKVFPVADTGCELP